ncbi:MAG TPA: ATP-binding cassette domain-containing protein [Adhaeribacter sp.]|nr:ATP-binding cassette domain-containing protein [Adhaeribacter sp.]
MINLFELTFSYENHTVLNCPEITFGEDMTHGIIGLNGAGKTTFFNLMATYLQPASGRLQLAGKPLTRADVAFLEAENFFYPFLTGHEYLGIFPETNPLFSLARLNELLQLPLNQVIETYSTGMRKKLALLAILKQDRPVYIFDEPFNGLDLETSKVLEMMLDRLKARGKTIFISSHILSPLLHCCDQIHLLQQGTFRNSFHPSHFPEIEAVLYGHLNQKAGEILDAAF